jgi:hypothetical protein
MTVKRVTEKTVAQQQLQSYLNTTSAYRLGTALQLYTKNKLYDAYI